MNKSKILKRSLAIVLAMMMIVAMIPLSASAAAAVVSGITVGGSDASGSGNTWTAEISTANAGNFTVTVDLQGGQGYVWYDIGSGATQASKDAATGTVFEIPGVDLNKLTGGKLPITTYGADGVTPTEVSLTIKAVAASTDATVKSFSVKGQYDTSDINDAANTITLTVPYDYAGNEVVPTYVLNAGSKASAEFDNSSDSSKKAYITTGSVTNKLVVTAESGATKTYKVVVKAAEGFTKFSVKGERLAADVGETTPNTIVVYLPYGTDWDDGSFEFTPTFTTGYSSVTVKSGDDTIKSGEAIDLADYGVAVSDHSTAIDPDADKITAAEVPLTINYSEGASEKWTLLFDIPAKDPEAKISAFKVANFAAEIDQTAKTITLALPASMRVAAGTAAVAVSEDVEVQVVNSTSKVTGTSAATDDLTPIDLSKDSQKLRVTAAAADTAAGATTPAVADYTLKISTQDGVKAELTTVRLQDAAGKDYDATINQSARTITLNVPFAKKANSDLAGFKIFWQPTNGSEVTSDGSDLVASGTTLTGSETFLPVDLTASTTAAPKTILVTVKDAAGAALSTKEYSVYAKRGAASKEAKLSAFNVVASTTSGAYAKLTANNQIKGSITNGAATATGTITVNVPDSKYADYSSGPYVVATISDNAKLYYVDPSSEYLTEVVTVAKGNDATVVALPAGSNYDGTGTPAKTLTLLVASEMVADGITATTTLDADFTTKAIQTAGQGSYKAFALTMTHEPAKSTYGIKSLELEKVTADDDDVVTVAKAVKATVNAANKSINFKVPFNFTDEYSAAQAAAEGVTTADVALLAAKFVTVDESTLDISSKGGTALVSLELTDEGKASAGDRLIVKLDSNTYKLYKYVDGSTGDVEIDKLFNVAEDGVDSQEYAVTVTVEDPKKGAELTSATINNVSGRPDSKQAVTINLPYGTEVTALKIKLAASDGAAIYYNGEPVDESATYNFTSPKSFLVVAEDGKETNTYTVTVTTSDQFKDVKPTDWFYDEVMSAANGGIVIGDGNGYFNPSLKVTRGDFALMIARATSSTFATDYADATIPFSDVAASTNAEKKAAIAYCADKKYINGKGDATFAPNQYINRQELATILAQVKGLDKVDSVADPFADDASIASWAKGWVYACVDAKLMVGTGTGFNPLGTASRAEAAAVSVRVSK